MGIECGKFGWWLDRKTERNSLTDTQTHRTSVMMAASNHFELSGSEEEKREPASAVHIVKKKREERREERRKKRREKNKQKR